MSRLDAPKDFLQDWAALYPKSGNATFFQNPAWMSAWLADIPAETELFRIEVRDGDDVKMLGVVGAAVRRAPALLGFSEARLHEFGLPEYDAIYVEYNDFLTVRDAEDLRAAALHALLDHFAATDGIVFRNATPAMTLALKEMAVSRSMSLRILNEQPVYGCDLATARAKETDFIETLSAGLQSKIRRSMRLYEERGALSCHVAQSPAEKERAWATLVELHETTWRARGQSGVFANRDLVAFHERLCAAAPEACQLFEVKAGNQTIAVLYNFLNGETVMNYQSGFLYEEDNRLTPGFVCHALACQHYMKEGFALYDFLAGDADYKKRLGEQQTTLTSLALDRPSFRRSVRDAVKGLTGRP